MLSFLEIVWRLFSSRRHLFIRVAAVVTLATLVLASDLDELFSAIQGDDPAKIRTILRDNPNLISATEDGSTALHVAVLELHPRKDVVVLLLDSKANVNAVDRFGRTPLHYAMLGDDPSDREIVNLLLAKGAKTKVKDNDGMTPAEFKSHIESTGVAAQPSPTPSGRQGLKELTPREEIQRIRGGRYSPLPPVERTAASGLSGRTVMNVRNSTAYELHVFFDGALSTKLTIAPGSSQTVDLVPGTFQIAGRVSAANVLPFYGQETYASSADYSLTFYIAP